MATPASERAVMSPRIKQAILLAIFFSLLGVTFVLRQLSPDSASAHPVEHNEALARYGFYFKDVTEACGIDFKHRPPVLDKRLRHIMPIIASMGAAVSVVDFDRDGWPDLYVIN